MKRKSIFFACALFALAFSANGAMASGRHDAGTAKGQGSSGNATASKKAKAVQDGFVFVEGGTFQMGDTFYAFALPQHPVKLNSFYICDHEVTQKEYRDITGNDPSYSKGDNRPVEKVSWYDAVEYCNALSVKKGLTPCYTIDKNKKDLNNKSDKDMEKWTVTCNFSANGYRLPTEAEWEYAARGGKNNRGYKYKLSGGTDFDHDDVAWHSDNSGRVSHDVKTKAPNELGLYDMSGNVFEWCWDWYEPYTSSLQTNPTGASSGSNRVFRSSSFYESWVTGSVFLRDKPAISIISPDFRGFQIGFRVVRSAQ